MTRKRLWLLIAPVLGVAAMVLPVLISPPAHWYEAPLFPVIRNAQEDLGLCQLVLFFAVGLILGYGSSSHALHLGAAAVLLLPLAAFAEMVVDSTSHNLFPFEFMFYAFYGLIVAFGAFIAHLASRRFAPFRGGA